MDSLIHALNDTNATPEDVRLAAVRVLQCAKAAASTIPIGELTFRAWVRTSCDLWDAIRAIIKRCDREDIAPLFGV